MRAEYINERNNEREDKSEGGGKERERRRINQRELKLKIDWRKYVKMEMPQESR